MRKSFHIVVRAIQSAALILLSIMGYVLGIDVKKKPLLADLIDLAQEFPVRIGLLAGLLFLVCEAIIRIFKPRSREQELIDRIIQQSLDEFRDKVFSNSTESVLSDVEPDDHNRVTLFQHKQWKWRVSPWRCLVWPWGWGRFPGSGWLVVVYRSGHVTKSTNTVFLAPDGATDAEGFAGRVWRMKNGKDVRISDLPDINDFKYVSKGKRLYFAFTAKCLKRENAWRELEPVRATVAEYAKVTNISESQVWDRIRRRKRSPISMVGFSIKNSSGEPWGVLIMDSSNAIECISFTEKKFREAMRELNRTLNDFEVTK